MSSPSTLSAKQLSEVRKFIQFAWEMDVDPVELLKEKKRLIRADNVMTEIPGQNVVHANFKGRDLERWDFRQCDIVHANFDNAKLKDSRWEGARIVHANFRGADLRDTRWKGAHIVHANLEGADLRGSDIRECVKATHWHLEGAQEGPSTQRSTPKDLGPKIRVSEIVLGDVICFDNADDIYLVEQIEDYGHCVYLVLYSHEGCETSCRVLAKDLYVWPIISIPNEFWSQIQDNKKDHPVETQDEIVTRVKRQILDFPDPLFQAIMHDFRAREVRAFAEWLIANRHSEVRLSNLTDYLIETNQEDRVWCGLREEYLLWADAMDKDDLDPEVRREFLTEFGPLGILTPYRAQETSLALHMKRWKQDPELRKVEEPEYIRAHYQNQQDIRDGYRLRELVSDPEDQLEESKEDPLPYWRKWLLDWPFTIGFIIFGLVWLAVSVF